MSVQVIRHKGTDVLYIDYTQAKNQDEMIAILHETVAFFRKSKNRVRTLTNMADAFVGVEYMAEMKRLTPLEFAHKAHKAAIIGIDPLKSILMNGYNKNTGNIEIFETRQEALDYLIA